MSEHWSSPNGCHPDCPACLKAIIDELKATFMVPADYSSIKADDGFAELLDGFDYVDQTSIGSAYSLANHKHQNQFRKHTGEPYIEHPVRVACQFKKTVQRYPITNNNIAIGICAALLHDTIEDTETTVKELEDAFGPSVAAIVVSLTVPKHVGNRETRVVYMGNMIHRAGRTAQLIKLCDIHDNIPSILEHDPDFAPVYFGEKLQVMSMMYEVCPNDGLLLSVYNTLLGIKQEKPTKK